MDYINYYPAAKLFLVQDGNTDEMDLDDFAIRYGEISVLVDFDSVYKLKVQPGEMEGVIDELVEDFREVVISTPKSLIKEEGPGMKEAAEQRGLPRSSAYKLNIEFNAGSASILPGAVKKRGLKGEPKKLYPKNTAFLIKIFDENPSFFLFLLKQSSNFSITQKCALSLEQAKKYNLERDAPRTIELRFNIITQWKAACFNFQENCASVDEGSFHSQMMRGRTWSKVGDRANGINDTFDSIVF